LARRRVGMEELPVEEIRKLAQKVAVGGATDTLEIMVWNVSSAMLGA